MNNLKEVMECDKQEIVDILSKYGYKTIDRRPFGFIEIFKLFTEDEICNFYHNTYFRQSLLYNNNTWL